MKLVAVLAIFVYGLMSASLGAALPSFNLTHLQQGNLTLANALGLVVASLAAGPFIDRKGKQVALVLGLTLIGVALLTAAQALFLSATFFTLGLGGGIVTTGANSLVSDISAEYRASALNFANLFFGLGGVLTTFAASYLFSPRTLFYLIAALAFGALLIATAMPVSMPSDKSHFRLNTFQNPILFAIALLLFLYVACEVGLWNWLKLYLISIHFSPQTAGGIVSYGFAFGMLAGRMAVARLLLKISAITVVIVSSVLIGITTFAMLHATSQAGVTVAVFATGLAMAPVFPTALSLLGDHFPQGTATAMGIVVTSGWLGLAISSPVIGALASKESLQSALFLLPGCAGAMVLVSLVLYTLLRKRHAT